MDCDYSGFQFKIQKEKCRSRQTGTCLKSQEMRVKQLSSSRSPGTQQVKSTEDVLGQPSIESEFVEKWKSCEDGTKGSSMFQPQ